MQMPRKQPGPTVKDPKTAESPPEDPNTKNTATLVAASAKGKKKKK